MRTGQMAASGCRLSRGLRFETLESRLALAADFTAAADLISLADYLAQPPEMGPVLEQAPADSYTAPLDGATVSQIDALVEQLAAPASPSVGTLEAEGEDFLPPPLPPPLPSLLPALTSFFAEHADGGWIRLYGTVNSATPAGTQVNFGGLFEGQSTVTDANGNFTLTVTDPGFGGFVTASMTLSPIVLSDYLD